MCSRKVILCLLDVVKIKNVIYSYLPYCSLSTEGRRYIQTVPVRLHRAQNGENGK
jgi:hypothetical protein